MGSIDSNKSFYALYLLSESMPRLNDVFRNIDDLKAEMVNSLIEMCKIPAIDPKSGGSGEKKKAEFIVKLIDEIGFDEVEWYNAPDDKVGYRPNIVAKLKGKNKGKKAEKMWVITHMDVVPPGDLKNWENDPFAPVIKNGRIFGRGVEDNGQALIASIYAVKSIKEQGLIPEMDINLGFVADEETGSEKGMEYLLNQGLFSPQDLILIPDYGSPDGAKIEVAEKSGLWLKINTNGEQCHASTPNKGRNALRAASSFLCNVDKRLHQEFNDKNPFFDVPYSTFEPTKKEDNVPNINTIPGDDVFYMDCRLLPAHSMNDVIALIKNVAREVERESRVEINVDIVQSASSPATAEDSKIVGLLKKAIKRVLFIDAEVMGIGGGTCASIFRNAGFDVAVWSTNEQTAHEANENIRIENLVNDAKVYASLFSAQ